MFWQPLSASMHRPGVVPVHVAVGQHPRGPPPPVREPRFEHLRQLQQQPLAQAAVHLRLERVEQQRVAGVRAEVREEGHRHLRSRARQLVEQLDGQHHVGALLVAHDVEQHLVRLLPVQLVVRVGVAPDEG